MQIKFYAYIAYLMVAVYLSQHFSSLRQEQQDERNFREQDFVKLFNFRYGEVQEPHQDSVDDHGVSAKFVRKQSYGTLDFQDHYEMRRYTTPFLVYKAMDWWPYLDILA